MAEPAAPAAAHEQEREREQPATEASRAAPAPAGPPPAPGGGKTLLSRALDAGAAALQSFHPINKICQHVCAFHAYAHDGTRQVRAHHYCSHINEEFRQCVIYDSDRPGARLIGIEYIISRRLYEGLPEEEKKLWHSHVLSGQLVTPGIPLAVANRDAEKLVDLGHELPLGPPQLMVSFTADGQLDPALIEERDRALGVSTAEARESRGHIAAPEPHPSAASGSWRGGRGWQIAADAGFRTGQALQAVLAPTAFRPPAPVPQHPLQMEGPEVLKTV
ncbi:hypothetical protein Rsub_02025 [Raphidocelis subcapitata]|uniref:DUF1264-domain-containing protein n=1 Tax=Raphidocelis subcapitata TaxID=307507 RepID=A0A2V0NV69_9CHLO|nr:hypothetical protein Rsub_02025 [Raphidocelis subcapitata]|eukprot:GBF89453.1 hypothetical protein Rsub_02025 [Raphidocelis subcapitata]